MIFAVFPNGTRLYRRATKSITWNPYIVSSELGFENVVRNQLSVGWNVSGFIVFKVYDYYYAVESEIADKYITRIPW